MADLFDSQDFVTHFNLRIRTILHCLWSQSFSYLAHVSLASVMRPPFGNHVLFFSLISDALGVLGILVLKFPDIIAPDNLGWNLIQIDYGNG